MKTLSPLTFKRSKYVNKEKLKDFPTLSSFNFKASSIAGIIERGINEICSQFCPAAPREFRQFCGAGRGGARPAFCGAGRGGAGQPVFPRGGAGRPSLKRTRKSTDLNLTNVSI